METPTTKILRSLAEAFEEAECILATTLQKRIAKDQRQHERK